MIDQIDYSKFVQNIDSSLEQLGVGGLSNQVKEIFRRVLSSRICDPCTLKEYSVNHVKGFILHGPPGTGKTLIARMLAKLIKAESFQVVNGPELLSKYVGQSEQNVRKLFDQAERDSQILKELSPVHVIAFDEFDALAKKRVQSQDDMGIVSCNIVNQLLSKIDGINQLNNILLIAMTNRIDLIDPAILRPGRFEVKLELGLPDKQGRQQILRIHTKHLRENGLLSSDVNLELLAEKTVNYTGAELEALVRSASSWAFSRINTDAAFVSFTGNQREKQNIPDDPQEVEAYEPNQKKKLCKNEKDRQLKQKDFENALEEIHPLFGCDQQKINKILSFEPIDYGKSFQKFNMLLQEGIEYFMQKSFVNNYNILVCGEKGSGKTSAVAFHAKNANFPFFKFILPQDLIGMSENEKVDYIKNIFQNAQKSKGSLIVLDQLESLLEYTDLSQNYSHHIFQAISALLQKIPENLENKTLVIATTSNQKVLKSMGLMQLFNQQIYSPQIRNTQEVKLVAQKIDFEISDVEIELLLQNQGSFSINYLLMFLERAKMIKNAKNAEDSDMMQQIIRKQNEVRFLGILNLVKQHSSPPQDQANIKM